MQIFAVVQIDAQLYHARMMDQPQKNAVLIVAAGRGLRAGGDIPKQWQMVAGKRLIDHTIARFRSCGRIADIVVVLHPDDMDELSDVKTVAGGATRAASVCAGLRAMTDNPPAHVLIHDAARPCVSDRIISDVLDALKDHDGAAPGLVVTDALWRTEAGLIVGGHSRDNIARAQTPQGFHFDAIYKAHLNALPDHPDDVAVALAAGLSVALVRGEEENLKVTHPQDFGRAARILRQDMTIRLGNGYDVHRFGPGSFVTLCGIELPHDRGLVGHSDADVGMHALTDAIYGALAEGDIGQHFPPSDPQWKGAASDIFLKHAISLARSKGYELANADVTLVCELPKIGPHSEKMRGALARIMSVSIDQISVKATTSETLGFTGRKEGIAALATAALVAK